MTVNPFSFDNLPTFLKVDYADDQRVLFHNHGGRLEIHPISGFCDASRLQHLLSALNLEVFLQGHLPSAVFEELRGMITAVKAGEEGLTVGLLRKIYKKVIQTRLDPLHQLLADIPVSYHRSNFSETTIILFKQGVAQTATYSTPNENIHAMTTYRRMLIEEFGEERVEKIAKRYDIDFKQLIEQAVPLTNDIVHQMTLGLNDVRMEDVHNLYNQLVTLSYMPQEDQIRTLHELPLRVYQGLMRVLDAQNDQDLINKINSDVLASSTQGLSRKQFEIFFDALNLEKGSEDAKFSGHMIEGAINSSRALLRHMLFFCRWYDDQERMQLVRDIINFPKHVTERQIELAYDELFAKALVKKELEEGMLIPAPPRTTLEGEWEIRWYVVHKTVIAGNGKLFYHLVPVVDYGDEMPERIEYRSTSSDPSMRDAVQSVISDIIHQKGPGYYCKDNGKDEELDIICNRGSTPLIINGHSLGGTLVMLSMVSAIESPYEIPLGKRIVLQFFDAPGIQHEDCRKFAEWILRNPERAKNIHIHAHISYEDTISGAGESHLGYGVDRRLIGSCRLSLLKANPTSKWIPFLDVNPHTQEFYQTEEGVDFTRFEKSIEKFDNAQWRSKWEALRQVFGPPIGHALRTIAATKIYLMGSRTKERGITQSVRKIAGSLVQAKDQLEDKLRAILPY